MRAGMIATGLALLASAGCNWTEFDDLEGQTWIVVQGPPNDESTDFGVALTRGRRVSGPGAGGSFVALGTGQAQYVQLVIDAGGTIDVQNILELNAQFGVGNLDLQPVLISDPASDEVGLVATTGGDQVTVLHGDGQIVDRQLFGPRQAFSATYMIAPVVGGGMTPSFPIVAAGPDEITSAMFPGPYVNYPNPAPRCDLKFDDNTAVNIRAVGAAFVTSTTTHDLVVWASDGSLLVYDGNVFNAQNGPTCPGTGTPPITAGSQVPLASKPRVMTPFMPSRGSHILMFEDRYAILVGHKDLNNPDSFLAMYDIGGATGAPTLVGTPLTIPELRTAALLTIGTDNYVVAGYPTATFDGVQAGRVQAFKFDTTNGISGESSLTLHDASPESGQQFGRAIAVSEFNGQQILAIGADNEVFVYFRTSLYGETREGK